MDVPYGIVENRLNLNVLLPVNENEPRLCSKSCYTLYSQQIQNKMSHYQDESKNVAGTLFYKNQIILAEPQCSYCFSKF